MTDIAPEIYEKIKERYEELVSGDKDMTFISDWIRSGKAVYSQAEVYAQRSGQYLSQAMQDVLKLDDLPNGKMYYNIAEKTIGRALEENYQLMEEAARVAQENMNTAAGIGLKAAVPGINREKVDRILDRAANADTQAKLNSALGEPVETYPETVIDDFKRVNAQLHNDAGLEVRVEREYDGVGLHNGTDVCDWCLERAGAWTYEQAMANGVFARHEGCGCIIEYTSKKGERSRSTDKWTWRDVIENPREKESKIISSTSINENAIIKATNSQLLRVNLQFFAESDIRKQESVSIQRGIRTLEKRKQEHEAYVSDPVTHCPDWQNKTEQEQQGLLKHWQKEIRNFEKSIQERISELKKRGDYYE